MGAIFGNEGPLLAAKTGPPRPILAAKFGPRGKISAKISPGGPFNRGTDFGVTYPKCIHQKSGSITHAPSLAQEMLVL